MSEEEVLAKIKEIAKALMEYTKASFAMSGALARDFKDPLDSLCVKVDALQTSERNLNKLLSEPCLETIKDN